MLVGLQNLTLWARALNVLWHGLLGTAWCTFRGLVSPETHTSMIGLVLMMDDWSYVRSLALILGLTRWGEVLDGHVIACDGTA
jgi:hypothetical protein